MLAKVTAVATFSTPAYALVLAPTLARWLLLIVARQPSARPGGMGDAFAASLTPKIFAMAAVVPFLIVVAMGWRGGPTVPAVLLALIATFAVLRLARNRLGGVTGDVFGLVVEMSELMVLLAFTAEF